MEPMMGFQEQVASSRQWDYLDTHAQSCNQESVNIPGQR